MKSKQVNKKPNRTFYRFVCALVRRRRHNVKAKGFRIRRFLFATAFVAVCMISLPQFASMANGIIDSIYADAYDLALIDDTSSAVARNVPSLEVKGSDENYVADEEVSQPEIEVSKLDVDVVKAAAPDSELKSVDEEKNTTSGNNEGSPKTETETESDTVEVNLAVLYSCPMSGGDVFTADCETEVQEVAQIQVASAAKAVAKVVEAVTEKVVEEQTDAFEKDKSETEIDSEKETEIKTENDNVSCLSGSADATKEEISSVKGGIEEGIKEIVDTVDEMKEQESETKSDESESETEVITEEKKETEETTEVASVSENSTEVETESDDTEELETEEIKDEDDSKLLTLDEWWDVTDSMYDFYKETNWTYDDHGTGESHGCNSGTSFDQVVNEGREYTTDCSIGASWMLQELGVLKENHTFTSYLGSSGSLDMSNPCAQDIIDAGGEVITPPSGTYFSSAAESGYLKPGDVLFYNGHVSIYCGESFDGATVYSCWDTGSTTGIRYGGPRETQWEDRSIRLIVRFF